MIAQQQARLLQEVIMKEILYNQVFAKELIMLSI
jgi:hypothetical protein